MTDFVAASRAIVAVGHRLDQRGLAPATAGNYSMRLEDGSYAITESRAHKGRLSATNVMRVDASGVALDGKTPSAETLLHCLVYAVDAHANAVLHTHSVAGTVLSRALTNADRIVLEGFEMLKIFPGVCSHDGCVTIPLVENSQNMAALASLLKPLLEAQSPLLPAFYIRGHGLYAWGATMDAAEYVVEASEFLLACAWEELKRNGGQR
jgi:methylthioribulose-1-phosphate dehydratase